jgi:ubiquinone/menaquinone biosynthesis C-methylase UbiE
LLERVAGARRLEVLDVGCGTGFLALQLAELGHTVTGVDLSEEMLDVARQKAAARGVAALFRLKDAEVVDGPPASFDLVIARHVIWTLPDPPAALRSWWRVVRPGGRLALIEGKWDDARRWETRDDQYAKMGGRLPMYGGTTAAELGPLMTSEGFVEIAVEPLMDPQLWGEAPTRERFLIVGRRPT